MDTMIPLDFKEFLKLLKDKKVEYLLIGGYAVGYYGYTRTTQNIDILIAIHPENARKIAAVLREFGFVTQDVSEDLFFTNR